MDIFKLTIENEQNKAIVKILRQQVEELKSYIGKLESSIEKSAKLFDELHDAYSEVESRLADQTPVDCGGAA